MSAKLYVLISGYQTIAKKKLLSTAEANQKIYIPVPYFLLDLGSDKILIDTGISENSNSAGALSDNSSVAEDGNPIKALHKIGIEQKDIKYIIHTHLHFDHAANTKYFPNSEVIVQLSELRAAFSDDPLIKHGYVEDDIRYSSIKWQPITSMRSLFGNRVFILPTLGHTPGHQSLLIRLKNYGNVIIAGDAAPLKDNIEKNIAPGVASNPDEAFYSIKSLKEFAYFENAQIWYGHDPEFFKNVNLSPEYYD